MTPSVWSKIVFHSIIRNALNKESRNATKAHLLEKRKTPFAWPHIIESDLGILHFAGCHFFFDHHLGSIGLASCFTVGAPDFSMMFGEGTSDRSCCCKKKQLGVQISFILTYSLLYCIRGSCSKGHIWFHTALDLTECQGQPMLH